MKGDLKSARKIATDAKSDAALNELTAKTQGLSELCQALEKAEAARTATLEKLKDGQEHTFETTKGTLKGVVLRFSADEIVLELKQEGMAAARPFRISDLNEAERKRLAGDFKPQTAAEHLAQAIRALAADDNAEAVAELAAARDHALTPVYQARLDEKLLGAAEATAKSAWDAIEREASVGKFSDSKSRELSDKVAAFQKEYGKTRFAASIVDKLAALQERLFGQAQQLALDLGGGVKLELVLIHPGKFMMGSPAAEAKRADTETQHEVTLTQSFYMSKYPVTQEQFELLMAKNPSSVKGARNPVDTASWNDAQEFCAKLSKKVEKTVKLPTEAQWEYACRAGSTTTYYFGDAEKDLGEYCWYHDNSDDKPAPPNGPKPNFAAKMTHPAGCKKPNAWGLYDMHGNVCQWCQDWSINFTEQASVDPTGPAQGQARVVRGGSCNVSADQCRSATRFLAYAPTRVNSHLGGFGFRVMVAKN